MTYHLRDDRALFTPLGDEGVLFDVETNKYHNLNITATRVLSGVKEGKPLADILQALLTEFDVPQDVCEREVANLLADLQKRGYVEAR